MLLEYKNKKEKEEIIKSAKSYNSLDMCLKKNYLIYGENLKALSMMLKKYKGKIDLIYIDPPYNSNQVFTVTSTRSNTVSKAINGKIAYSDNFSKEEYVEFIRERLIVLRELLSEQGSIYLHIDDKMGHYIKIIMDEVFGFENFKNDISRVKSNPKNFGRRAYGNQKDTILFYSKNHKKNIFNDITEPLTNDEIVSRFKKVDKSGRRYTTVPVHAPGETINGVTGQKWKGMYPPKGRHWRYPPDRLTELDNLNLIEWSKTGNPRIKNFADENKGKKVQDIWVFKDPTRPKYPTEKNNEMLDFIVRQSSNIDSIILDCFVGSGTILSIAEKLDRIFIGIDESEIAIKSCIENLSDANYVFIDLEQNVFETKEAKIKQTKLPILMS